MCAALFVGFSYDRRFFVLVLILLVFFVLLIIVVRISRRRKADKRPVDLPGGNVLGDVRSHVSSCLDVGTFRMILN